MKENICRSEGAEQLMERKMDRLVILVCGLRPQRMSNGYGKKNG